MGVVVDGNKYKQTNGNAESNKIYDRQNTDRAQYGDTIGFNWVFHKRYPLFLLIFITFQSRKLNTSNVVISGRDEREKKTILHCSFHEVTTKQLLA